MYLKSNNFLFWTIIIPAENTTTMTSYLVWTSDTDRSFSADKSELSFKNMSDHIPFLFKTLHWLFTTLTRKPNFLLWSPTWLTSGYCFSIKCFHWPLTHLTSTPWHPSTFSSRLRLCLPYAFGFAILPTWDVLLLNLCMACLGVQFKSLPKCQRISQIFTKYYIWKSRSSHCFSLLTAFITNCNFYIY